MYHPGFASAWLSKSPTDDLDSYTGDGDWFKILSVTGRTDQSLDFSDPENAIYYDPYKAPWGTFRVDSVSHQSTSNQKRPWLIRLAVRPASSCTHLTPTTVELHDSPNDTSWEVSTTLRTRLPQRGRRAVLRQLRSRRHREWEQWCRNPWTVGKDTRSLYTRTARYVVLFRKTNP